jgi:RNA polymerase sigma factor (sigma-70 family)
MPPSNPTETGLPNSAAAISTHAAVLQYLEDHRRDLTAYCFRMLASSFEAEDAAQETIVRAWRAADRFDGETTVRSWLYRIATNVCLDRLRGQRRRMPSLSLDDELEALLEMEAEWLQEWRAELARRDVRLAFVQALQTLPPRQRAVVVLREVMDYRATEVADLLDTSVASVNAALQRALATLRESLPPELGETAGAERHVALLRELNPRGWESRAVGDVPEPATPTQSARERRVTRVAELASDLTPAIDVPSPSELLQAQRNAVAQAEALLEFGAYTSAEVADLVGSSARNRSAVASRLRREGRLIGVDYRGSTYFPAFQFSGSEPLPIVAEATALLRERGWSDWQQLLWWTTRSDLLDGRRPVDVINEPEAVRDAATREVEEFVG